MTRKAHLLNGSLVLFFQSFEHPNMSANNESRLPCMSIMRKSLNAWREQIIAEANVKQPPPPSLDATAETLSRQAAKRSGPMIELDLNTEHGRECMSNKQ